jgi:hypothetical protein
MVVFKRNEIWGQSNKNVLELLLIFCIIIIIIISSSSSSSNTVFVGKK